MITSPTRDATILRRPANHDADRQIDDAALHGKFFESDARLMAGLLPLSTGSSAGRTAEPTGCAQASANAPPPRQFALPVRRAPRCSAESAQAAATFFLACALFSGPWPARLCWARLQSSLQPSTLPSFSPSPAGSTSSSPPAGSSATAGAGPSTSCIQRHGSGIPGTRQHAQDARVAARARLEARPEIREQFLDDLHVAQRANARRRLASPSLLASVDQRARRPAAVPSPSAACADGLVSQQRNRHVAHQLVPVRAVLRDS